MTVEVHRAVPARRQTFGVRRLWDSALGVAGAVMGLVPHVLHHVGFLAGTALVAGSGGTAVFGVVGLLASVPLLVKLRRRFRTWRAPAIGLAVFTVMFAVSAFVLGPALSRDAGRPPAAPTGEHQVDHDYHHG